MRLCREEIRGATFYVCLLTHLAYWMPGCHSCTHYTGWRKKRPEHLHALFSRVVKMNQHKSIYVMTKHQRICVGIFCLKHFCISCDTNKIASHAIRQFLQMVYHLRCRSYASYTKASH